MNQVRIDKWLCAARFFKTRGVATEAVLGGRAHVNGERVKPSKVVRVGDTVEVTIGTVRWTVAVKQLDAHASSPSLRGRGQERRFTASSVSFQLRFSELQRGRSGGRSRVAPRLPRFSVAPASSGDPCRP